MSAPEPVRLRGATPDDGAACAALYAPIVERTVISMEIQPPDAAAMAERIAATLPTHPWLVAERDGAVVAYAYAAPHRSRAGYRWSADVSAYVAEPERGRGLGRALYRRLIATLTLQGFANAYAGIALPNPASVGLHEGLGFRPVGVYRNVGFKLGRWIDVGWWGLALRAADSPPEEPIPFAALRPEDLPR